MILDTHIIMMKLKMEMQDVDNCRMIDVGMTISRQLSDKEQG